MKDFLNTYIENNKENILKDLSDLIAIPSVSADKDKVAEALEFTLKLGEKMGFRSINCLDGQVGVIEAGDGPETLGILAHVDVVPEGDIEDWNTDPFKATIIDGKMYGRGTLDDKGMVIAALYGMKAAMETGQPFKKKVQLILGTQEEVSWDDMYAYIENYPLPDYGFSPDGEYPICNVEKGMGNFDIEFDIKDEELDPAGLYVTSVTCGTAKNAVPGKASATLSDGRVITATGKIVHSCQPERGINALFLLVDQLKEIGVSENKLMKLLEVIKYSFEDIFGSKIGLYSESEYYQGEFVHRNAFSATMFNTDGDKAMLVINNRFPYGESEDNLLQKMTVFAEANGGKIIEFESMPAVFVSKERPFLQVLADAYESVTGIENEFTLAYGGSYAKAMPNVVSWAPIFPGEEDTCHENNEYIGVDSLMDSTKIFAQSVAGIVFTDESLK